jgi:hypothetical protein
MEIPQKVIEVLYDPTILFMGTYPKELKAKTPTGIFVHQCS